MGCSDVIKRNKNKPFLDGTWSPFFSCKKTKQNNQLKWKTFLKKKDLIIIDKIKMPSCLVIPWLYSISFIKFGAFGYYWPLWNFYFTESSSKVTYPNLHSLKKCFWWNIKGSVFFFYLRRTFMVQNWLTVCLTLTKDQQEFASVPKIQYIQEQKSPQPRTDLDNVFTMGI